MKIGFFGAGKMARALASGLVRADKVDSANILCTSRTEQSGAAFLQAVPGSRWVGDSVALAHESEFVILAIKPQQFAAALPPVSQACHGKLVLSLAAGITLKTLRELLPGSHIVRAMPNTPMQIGAGASVYAGDANVTENDFSLVDRVLQSGGRAWRVEENQINTITALSGSGPAYVFHFLAALEKAAIALGLDPTLAGELARQTVLGSAQLAAQSPLTSLELAAQVKSPGGTTVAGCAVLEENQALDELMRHCLAAAKNRADALARGEA